MKQFVKWFLSTGIKQYWYYFLGFGFIGTLVFSHPEYLDSTTAILITLTLGSAFVATIIHMIQTFNNRNK